MIFISEVHDKGVVEHMKHLKVKRFSYSHLYLRNAMTEGLDSGSKCPSVGILESSQTLGSLSLSLRLICLSA